jgi:hypothetical protein
MNLLDRYLYIPVYEPQAATHPLNHNNHPGRRLVSATYFYTFLIKFALHCIAQLAFLQCGSPRGIMSYVFEPRSKRKGSSTSTRAGPLHQLVPSNLFYATLVFKLSLYHVLSG